MCGERRAGFRERRNAGITAKFGIIFGHWVGKPTWKRYDSSMHWTCLDVDGLSTFQYFRSLIDFVTMAATTRAMYGRMIQKKGNYYGPFLVAWE